MIAFIVLIVIFGLCLYLVETYIPMSPPIKTVLRVVVVLIIIVMLLQLVGVDTGLPRFNIR